MVARKAHPFGRGVRWAAWALAAAVVWPAAAGAAERVALVIGNSDYKKPSVPFLANPRNDARAMGDAFERLGFEVTRLEDAGFDDLRLGLQKFEKAAARSEFAVVFYAGHGIEMDKHNYLVPVDAALASDRDVKHEAMKLSRVLESVEGASRLRLVILDACRNNPFEASMRRTAGTTRSVERGLARVEPSKGTLVAYAAKEGTTADDEGGKGHSPFTEALLARIETPGLEVWDMFRDVAEAVWASTGQNQLPFTYGSVPRNVFYLAGKGPQPPKDKVPAAPTTGVTSPVQTPSGDAARAYEAAERAGIVAAYRAFIRRFPGSYEAELAQVHIDKIEGKPQPIVVAGGDDMDETAPPPAKSSPEAVEQGLGLSVEARRLVQMGLAAAGHDPGPVDGMLGGKTRRALKAWQASKEVEGTGYLTREQSEALVALGREEAERLRVAAEQRAREEAERREREAEERRLAAERERKAREAEERRKRARKPGDTFRDCPGCPEMVVVPEGSFRMGSPESEKGRDDDEGPVRQVTIEYRFAVGVYEVTFEEWDACERDSGCGGYWPDDEGWGRGSRPVINVSWEDARAYVDWLSRKTGEAYRLLSEAEWEYVARAGTTGPYHFGRSLSPSQANYGDDRGGTVSVGSYSANGFGLHDVHGNVWEWVEDCWNGSYYGVPSDGSAWTSGDCSTRVLRGGSWSYDPGGLRAANRGGNDSGDRLNVSGFRVARTLAR